MREILFRGKTDDGEWVYGSFCMDAREQFDGLCGVDGFIRLYDKAKGKMQTYEVDRETVGQYTGLTDKNGKWIFEGDIVKAQDEILGSPFCDGMTGKVVYDETAYFIELKDPMNSQWLYDECAVYEVIGNVHDNPELLDK